jgi:multidrug efflux pump subunit AcrA (membrane-fusion protein)
VEINNYEVAEDANRKRLMRWVFFPWFKYAHARAEEERQEVIARENKIQFDRMLKEAEEATQLLVRLEKEREERLKAQEAERQRIEKEQRLLLARQRMQREKEDEERIILKIQKEERMKRIAKDIKQLKSTFKKAFDRKSKDMLVRAKDRTTGYIENPDNKLAIEMKLQVLKKEFFANPSPETRERERILSSYRNIMFLYIDAKLRADGVEMSDLIPRFDIGGKGYLTYAEFGMLVRSLKTTLSEAQINGVIRSIDADRDGYITLPEIAEGMREIDQMGIPGSPWKIYIDPAEDVICYHNFVTNQKIYEFQMTDPDLRNILIANMYAEAEQAALAEIKELRVKNWDETIKNYMARRMQYMYRVWKARRWRNKKVWKVEKRVLRMKQDLQKVCVRFMERTFLGYKSRVIFKKQLHLTIEKVFDVDSKQIFYYNHMTKESSWIKPYLIKRYGDVSNPCPWIPLDQTKEDALQSGNSDGQTQYWHVTAKRAFPKKPDGYLICGQCNYLLAIRKCTTCQINYCFVCHRNTHGNPLGFFQNTKAKKEQFSDPGERESSLFFILNSVLIISILCRFHYQFE